MKGKIVLALAVIISLSMPAAFSDTKISVEYMFDPAVLGNVCDTCDFKLENVNIREIPGEPIVLYNPKNLYKSNQSTTRNWVTLPSSIQKHKTWKRGTELPPLKKRR